MAGNQTNKAVTRPAGWPSRVDRVLGRGIDLAYPPVCACCQDAIEPGSSVAVCPTCRSALVDARPACPRCGASAPAAGGRQPCPWCGKRRFHFHCVSRLGAYHGALREAVLRTKRPTGRALAAALGNLLAELAGPHLAALRLDVVVPIPMHWTRRVWRGANGADVIAGQLARRLRLPMRPGLLRRSRRTAPQASVPRSRRRANVRGAFHARKHADLPGARILLVDDIMTSGATVNEAARTLSRAGVESVAVAVLARAEGID